MKNTYKSIIAIIVLVVIIFGAKYLSNKTSESTQTPVSSKLNIDTVCQSALAYMTFPDGASAEAFVNDCKEGKYPEVIERYKAEMNLGDGANI